MNDLECAIERFELYYEHIVERVANYKLHKPCELIVTLNDGKRMIYYQFENMTFMISPINRERTEDDVRLDFSICLLRLLYKKNISQLELSKMTGLTPAMISRYLHKKATPSLYIMDKIARAIDCSIKEFSFD